MDDLVERSSIRTYERPQRPSNGVAKSDEVYGEVPVGKPEDTLRLLLVDDAE